jgi:hypothetical protein
MADLPRFFACGAHTQDEAAVAGCIYKKSMGMGYIIDYCIASSRAGGIRTPDRGSVVPVVGLRLAV